MGISPQRQYPAQTAVAFPLSGQGQRSGAYLALGVFDLTGKFCALGDQCGDDVREDLCCAILRPMDEIGMVVIWLVIIAVTAIVGIVTDSPTTAVIAGILATGLGGLLVVRRQPR